jgi:hypothetical protein
MRPVIGIEEGGAALGAAAAAAAVFLRAEDEARTCGRVTRMNADDPVEMTAYPIGLLKSKKAVQPGEEDMKAFHGAGGYLEKFAEAEARVLFGI